MLTSVKQETHCPRRPFLWGALLRAVSAPLRRAIRSRARLLVGGVSFASRKRTKLTCPCRVDFWPRSKKDGLDLGLWKCRCWISSVRPTKDVEISPGRGQHSERKQDGLCQWECLVCISSVQEDHRNCSTHLAVRH